MKLFFFAFFIMPFQTFSQDITGIWTGSLQIGDTKLPYELIISGKSNNLSGYSLVIFTFNNTENVGIKTMEIKVKRGSISIEDGELIYDNYTTAGRKVKLYGTLAWVGKNQSMTLAGTFSTRSMDMRAPSENSFKGTIFLQKNNPKTRTRLISKLADMDLLKELSFVKPIVEKEESAIHIEEIKPSPIQSVPRKTKIIRAVLFHSDSLLISLYDNGEVDGDTVSVMLNNKVLISKQGLTAKAITTTIPTSELGDSSELIMYAENLGRIPPNTGLLVLQDGDERYQIRFSGDLQKNSAIILRKKH